MSYATIMAPLEPGQSNADALQVAHDLAWISDAHVIDIVAGAHGHGRMRAWALGGVTRGPVLRKDRPALESH